MGEGRTRASALRPGNGPWHQNQTVAVTRPTTPQRGHDARCGGRCKVPPQALQNLESAGLRWPQDGQRVVAAEKTRVARRRNPDRSPPFSASLPDNALPTRNALSGGLGRFRPVGGGFRDIVTNNNTPARLDP